jgi:hypothetical protein
VFSTTESEIDQKKLFITQRSKRKIKPVKNITKSADLFYEYKIQISNSKNIFFRNTIAQSYTKNDKNKTCNITSSNTKYLAH